MHEISIASAILESAVRLTPAGAILRSVTLRAGPMRGIEREPMQWAWQGATEGTRFDQVQLELQLLPWHLRCPACGIEFDNDDLFAVCACGETRAYPIGGDELQIVSITVDDDKVVP